jgi:large subunit ribosomal protein L13
MKAEGLRINHRPHSPMIVAAASLKSEVRCAKSHANSQPSALDIGKIGSYSSRSRFTRFLEKDLSMSTYFPSGNGLAENRKWHVVDADGKTVGHLASEVAAILSGKRNPQWTPFMDMGDHVIVVNARKAMFTGAKATDKVYRRHTLYPGGLRETSVTEMFTKHPERVIELAVKGMLPKTKLGKAMAKKLKVYADAEHPHSAQMPQALDLPSRNKK